MGLILYYCLVIHHLGDDFGDKSLSMEKSKRKMKAVSIIFIIKRISSFTNGILLERR
jgi:hypothetical protein